MSVIDAIVVGVVQGLSEFLPISSSGHLVVTRYFYGINDISQSYIILLHVGTLIAVCAAMWKDIFDIIKKVLARDQEGINLALAILVTVIPAALVGFFLSDRIDALFYEKGMYIMGGRYWLEPYKFVGMAFIATAYFFIGPSDVIIRNRIENDIHGSGPEAMTFTKALTLGCIQAIAIIPGISRCGATIYGGLKNGFSREYAARFSFLMSIPVILGAFVKDLLDVNVRTKLIYDRPQLNIMLLGVAIAAVVGFLAIKLLIRLITSRDLRPFGVYLWILGLVCIAS
jgi:undecaprenyl-diphosphatase